MRSMTLRCSVALSVKRWMRAARDRPTAIATSVRVNEAGPFSRMTWRAASRTASSLWRLGRGMVGLALAASAIVPGFSADRRCLLSLNSYQPKTNFGNLREGYQSAGQKPRDHPAQRKTDGASGPHGRPPPWPREAGEGSSSSSAASRSWRGSSGGPRWARHRCGRRGPRGRSVRPRCRLRRRRRP